MFLTNVESHSELSAHMFIQIFVRAYIIRKKLLRSSAAEQRFESFGFLQDAPAEGWYSFRGWIEI